MNRIISVLCCVAAAAIITDHLATGVITLAVTITIWTAATVAGLDKRADES